MTHRLAVLALLVGFAGCKEDKDDGLASCDSCTSTDQAFGLTERTVHDARSKTFLDEAGVAYTLVRVEYGDTPECSDPDSGDDEDCWYSTYCGFIVDNTDSPLEVHWVTDADALFDPALYCEDGDLETCDLPGSELPILDDAAFEDWLYETDPEDVVLVDCFAEYW